MTFGKKSVERIDTKHPKIKTDALVVKAMTLEAKTMALKAKAHKVKAKGMNFCPRGSSKPRPVLVLEDYNTGRA